MSANDFDSAFAEAAEAQPVVDEFAENLNPEDVTPVEDSDEDPPALDDPPDPAPAAPVVDPEDSLTDPPAVEPPAEVINYEQRFKSLEGRFNAVVEENRRLKDPVPPTIKEEALPPGKSEGPESGTLLEGFTEEYPEIAEAVLQLVDQKVNQSASQIEQRVAPLEAEKKRTATETHFAAIGNVHADYETVAGSPEFSQWIDSQPDYVSQACHQVVQQGTANQVVDLLTRFKENTPDPAGEIPDPDPDPLPESPRVAAAMAVKSRGRKIPKGKINDFDGAFNEACGGK